MRCRIVKANLLSLRNKNVAAQRDYSMAAKDFASVRCVNVSARIESLEKFRCD